ncbi:MAG: PhoU domain-containing protein [Candidatus Diapherotrites archaeon]|nr:PhoU domain-containing protein [Candidatus Diapherotrites archaeon]
MHRRKIQLVAGTSYSISLPKAWVKANHLKAQDELVLTEQNDQSLVISPHATTRPVLEEIHLNTDEYPSNIDQILFSVYYLGVETIHLTSKSEFSKETKTIIRKTLHHMSGTEIIFEDQKKITIKVLLDQTKLEMPQILYRISLIIDASLSNTITELDLSEIKINENEIDRLYHLLTKIVSLSLTSPAILHSSKIRDVSFIPSYFLICKKLENIGDNIKDMAMRLPSKTHAPDAYVHVIQFIRKELQKSTRHITNEFPSIFEPVPHSELARINRQAALISDPALAEQLKETVRYTEDIEREIVNLSFYTALVREKKTENYEKT